ncbi:SOS response-associated peptidase [Epibacterium ulvae]|uniref:SOS response-associated peptidase n=1 Tax=Epibacterium ulvae TaxID=1156985 RepID=UPI00248FEAD0|nr:SOS response-associated peptidase [Epibacterium ulvae]
MCGRFVDPNLRGTDVEHVELKINPIPRRYNVKPTNDVLIYRNVGAYARWWLVPHWHGGTLKEWKATTFNARIEEASSKPAFREAWQKGRCLIPLSGYYEWRESNGAKSPYYISGTGNENNLWAAGLASQWRGTLTCTMLTRPANASVSDIHHRMPVLLNTDEIEAWLGGTDDLNLGAETLLRHHEVAKIGRDDDGDSLIEPI